MPLCVLSTVKAEPFPLNVLQTLVVVSHDITVGGRVTTLTIDTNTVLTTLVGLVVWRWCTSI